MDIHAWVWAATIGVLILVLLADLLIVGRRPHEPSMREASMWVVFYVAFALLFGLGVWLFSGPRYAGEFYAGWLTEYSLSVDNLFIFVIIMSRFAVPRQYQQTVLLIGIALALVLRGIFIAIGAAAIENFHWVFYIFGAFLLYTAYGLIRQGEMDDSDYTEPRVVRSAKRLLPATGDYHGTRLIARVDGRRLVTPMFFVIIAIGMTDLLFALDSIPAIFGLTEEAYLVFTANVFALMGLRQLYFLIGGLLSRLVYLSVGLSVILGFIGVKLILEALHTNRLSFVNDGQGFEWAPEIPIWLSLLIIIGTLVIVTVASLAKTRWEARAQRSDTPEG